MRQLARKANRFIIAATVAENLEHQLAKFIIYYN